MKELPSVAYSAVADLFVIVHIAVEPTDGDWNELMAAANSMDTLNSLLVVAGEATLSATQRATMHELYKKNKMRIAVMTNSRVARGVLTALKWFGVPTEAVPLNDLSRALTHCGCPQHLDTVSRETEKYIAVKLGS